MKQPSGHVTRADSECGISRRSFLSLIAGLAGAGLLGGCAPPDEAAAPTETWSAWLLAGDDNRDAVVRLGQAYLQAYPDDADRQALSDRLAAALALHAPGDATVEAVSVPGTALETTVRDDYATGEIVSVSGWILSRTEARAYALVAMMDGV
jgi:ABC-type glycerol-3-phosphate transport system substrate-binding protein